MQERVTLVSKNQLEPGESLASQVTSHIHRKAAKGKRKQVRRLRSSIVCGVAAVIDVRISLVIGRRGFYDRPKTSYEPCTILFRVSDVRTSVDHLRSIWYERRPVINFSREAPLSLEYGPKPSSRWAANAQISVSIAGLGGVPGKNSATKSLYCS
jgi:hypothetical protein